MKIRTSCRVFLQGFVGFFLAFQCVLGILYWSANVTRSQQFDTVSTMGKLMAALPALPVHLIQTGLVFAAAYYFFRRFFKRRRSVLCALAAVTVPFVMQVCLSETEHAVALAAILCMTAGIADSHTHRESRFGGRTQTCLLIISLSCLISCGAAYSCAAALLFGIWFFIEWKKELEKKHLWILCVLVIVLSSVLIACYGSYCQNRENPDRMQISIESVLFKRFAYPGLNLNLLDGMPQEMQELYSASGIEELRLYPYQLDTELDSSLKEAVGEERTREIYLELAWYGFQCGTRMDLFMMLEDTLCYLTPQLMYPFYSNGTILAEFGFSFQQFISGNIYLSSLYLYGSLLGYGISLLLTLLYGLLSGFANHYSGIFTALKRCFPVFLLWFGLSLIFMMRGAAIFNYKYAAFQTILGYMPLIHVLFSQTEGEKSAEMSETENATAGQNCETEQAKK